MFYAPVAHARLLIEPCEAKCSVQLEGSTSAALGKGRLLGVQDMGLDFAVSGSLSGADPGVSDNDMSSVQASRPSSAFSERNAARRHQVAIEAQPYFEQHHLMDVMQVLLQSVIKDKPEDPYAYMIGVLENSRNVASGALPAKGKPEAKVEQAKLEHAKLEQAVAVPRQRPSSAQARTGPAPKPLPSALRPSSSRTPGQRPRTSEKVSWSQPLCAMLPDLSSKPLSATVPAQGTGSKVEDVEGSKVEDIVLKEATLLPSQLQDLTKRKARCRLLQTAALLQPA